MFYHYNLKPSFTLIAFVVWEKNFSFIEIPFKLIKNIEFPLNLSYVYVNKSLELGNKSIDVGAL
jgi:hypothetical protein